MYLIHLLLFVLSDTNPVQCTEDVTDDVVVKRKKMKQCLVPCSHVL